MSSTASATTKKKPAAKAAPKAKAAAPKATPKAKTATPQKPAKQAAKPATSREAMLARVESVRLEQRAEGHFDCFGRASDGYCDQGGCAYHAECLSVSRMLHEV